MHLNGVMFVVLRRNIMKKPPSDGVRPRLLKTLRSKRWVLVTWSLTIFNGAALVWHPNSGPAVTAARQHEGTCDKTQQEDGEQQSRGNNHYCRTHTHTATSKAVRWSLIFRAFSSRIRKCILRYQLSKILCDHRVTEHARL